MTSNDLLARFMERVEPLVPLLLPRMIVVPAAVARIICAGSGVQRDNEDSARSGDSFDVDVGRRRFVADFPRAEPPVDFR